MNVVTKTKMHRSAAAIPKTVNVLKYVNVETAVRTQIAAQASSIRAFNLTYTAKNFVIVL